MFSLSGIELDLLPHLTPTTNFQTFLLQALPANNQPPNARNAWEQNVSQSIQETLTNSGPKKMTRASLNVIVILPLVDFRLKFAADFTTGNLTSSQN